LGTPGELCKKTADPIDMPFGGLTHVGPVKHALDGGRDPPLEGQFWGLSGSDGYAGRFVLCLPYSFPYSRTSQPLQPASMPVVVTQ